MTLRNILLDEKDILLDTLLNEKDQEWRTEWLISRKNISTEYEFMTRFLYEYLYSRVHISEWFQDEKKRESCRQLQAHHQFLLHSLSKCPNINIYHEMDDAWIWNSIYYSHFLYLVTNTKIVNKNKYWTLEKRQDKKTSLLLTLWQQILFEPSSTLILKYNTILHMDMSVPNHV